MLSFFDRTAPLYGLPIYWFAAQFNPVLAAALFNVYLVIVLITLLKKIMKANKGKPQEVAKVNTASWVSSIAVMLITIWGVVTTSSLFIIAVGVIVVMSIETIRKRKLDKE
ncbi:hypothetical protein OBP_217 [Pseudomonas phage OBP]|uniref:hypothetical protein n=1 Tax=Pseudomonas phage OBP TaxID=1124849 RepID=UPI000240D5BD|nr:hypothetical protein OBP_217 [Pseudomonas phage OBP]AEV89654.1 hypothetical protein OBP_217 [Pseudomonas phage OBP]